MSRLPVAALLSDGSARHLVLSGTRHRLPRTAADPIAFFTTWDGFSIRVLAMRPSLLFIDPLTRGYTAPALAELHRCLPEATIIGVLDSSADGSLEAFALSRNGVDAIVMRTRGLGDARHLRNVVEDALARRLASHVIGCVGPRIPDRLREFVERLWTECRRPIEPPEASALYHRDRATLGRHLRAGGLPPVNQLIGWGRLSHAADALHRGGLTVGAVVAVLDFPSEEALRNQFHRYVRSSPTAVRREGLRTVVADFVRRCEIDDWPLHRIGPERDRDAR